MKIYPDFKNQNSRPQNSSYITDNRVPDWHLPSFSSLVDVIFFTSSDLSHCTLESQVLAKRLTPLWISVLLQIKAKDLPGAVNVLPTGLGDVLKKRASREIKMEVRNHCCFFTCILVRSATFQPWFEMMYVKWPYRKNCRSLIPAFDL